MTATLLVEIGLEELPPAAMRPLAETFAEQLGRQLDEAGLAHGTIEPLATPRRLAVRMADVAAQGQSETIEKQGPTVAIAYDEAGTPTQAGEGFARSVGVSMDDLEVEDSDKGQRLVYRGVAEGRPLTDLLQPAVDAALRSLPIPKRMRWGDSEAAFVRPVHWVVAMHGDRVLPLSVFGITATATTRGHRFHHPDDIPLSQADDYIARLRAPGHVIVDMVERERLVTAEVHAAAATLGGTALVSPDLITEVTALVEWPVGIAGHFDTRYLALPREVLIATLEGHQRYFPVAGETGALIAGFVTVANIASRDPAQVVAGNERVVHPRLADALFFWNADRQQSLEARVNALAAVSFQQALGSLADKSTRVQALAGRLAEATGADPKVVTRAARLAKTDLLTEMVDEFPELQGIMGGYYATHDSEPAAVATAIVEQYAPAAAGAPIPVSPAGQALAMADRLDTLTGIFAIDKRPSGDKDPFGLRRATLGVVRTLIEGDIRLDLAAALGSSLAAQPVTPPAGTAEALWQFVMERLRGYGLERGFTPAEFESIAGQGVTDLVDFDARLHAVAAFARLDAAPIVCGAHKRIRNILRRNSDAEIADAVTGAQLSESAEIALHEALTRVQADIERDARASDYTAALSALASLAAPLDTFFDEVMVMTDDVDRRANRLALLATIDALCRRVADVSCLSVESTQ
ncbi:glycine--tRNA ligase subunit beta [Salinisphaera sp. Q1T1-3]|uniref:glycine--tRNA ligase subunit beta n=1 Tax=Salinisphaera sp. Q1T1-3 TaxID=2321229 RepID=UPI000E72872D|nr:glycine--tRNA ligase subunit beta [Salinisphaera sp. Q1T1-3]RJS92561.1 glycine--tRNA ligase subunit beta [Salinisphaera sp. Q1T1-3]